MTESSLRGYDRPADRIRLHRQSSNNAIVVVEGPSDQRLCRQVFQASIDYFPVGSRDGVLATAVALSVLDVKSICYIVDRDFDDRVEDAEDTNATIIPYDNGDLEAMLIESPALDRLLGEFASKAKVAQFGGPDAVRSHLIETVSPVATLRRANALESWGLVFDGVDLTSKYKNGALQSKALVDALLAASPDSTTSKPELLRTLQQATPTCPTTERTLFRGRDAISLLPLMLKKAIASRKDKPSSGLLESALRLAASSEALAHTSWHERVSNSVQPFDAA